MKLTYAGGKQVNITYANDAIPDNGYAMFNPKYGLSVPDCGAAMIVKTDGPVNPGTHSGTVLSVGSGGGRVIPFDCCAIVANGTAATELLANANAGDTVTIDFSMTTKLTDNSTTITADQIAGTMAGLTGSESVLENGVVKTYTSDLMTSRHRRSLQQYIHFPRCLRRQTERRVHRHDRRGAGQLLQELPGRHPRP